MGSIEMATSEYATARVNGVPSFPSSIEEKNINNDDVLFCNFSPTKGSGFSVSDMQGWNQYDCYRLHFTAQYVVLSF